MIIISWSKCPDKRLLLAAEVSRMLSPSHDGWNKSRGVPHICQLSFSRDHCKTAHHWSSSTLLPSILPSPFYLDRLTQAQKLSFVAPLSSYPLIPISEPLLLRTFRANSPHATAEPRRNSRFSGGVQDLRKTKLEGSFHLALHYCYASST